MPNKKHVEKANEDCECLECTMRSEASNHLYDTYHGLVMLYAERFDVDEAESHAAVTNGLMDVLVGIVVSCIAGAPDEKKVLNDVVADLRARVKVVREKVAEETHEDAVATTGEAN